MASRDTKLTLGTIAKVLLWFVYVWVILNLVLLFLAFVLLLFGANPEAGFTQWVYRSVSRSMAPFRGIFEPIVISDKSVLDTSLLFAMIIYGLIALLISAGIDWATGFVTRRRRQMEREVWDDRLEAMSTASTTSASYPAAGGPPPSPAPHQSNYPPFDQPPPR